MSSLCRQTLKHLTVILFHDEFALLTPRFVNNCTIAFLRPSPQWKAVTIKRPKASLKRNGIGTFAYFSFGCAVKDWTEMSSTHTCGFFHISTFEDQNACAMWRIMRLLCCQTVQHIRLCTKKSRPTFPEGRPICQSGLRASRRGTAGRAQFPGRRPAARSSPHLQRRRVSRP